MRGGATENESQATMSILEPRIRNSISMKVFLAKVLPTVLLAASLAVPSQAGQAPPTDGKEPTTGPSIPRPKFGSRKYSSTSSTARPSIPAPPAPGATSNPASPATPTAAKPATGAPASPAAEEPGKDLVGSIVDFLAGNAILVAAALLLAAGLLTFFLWPRSKKAETAPEIRSPIRPKADEDEGPRRVLVTPGAAPKTPEKEVEKDYALVVNEEDLKMPPLPEEKAARKKVKVDSTAIQELIARDKFVDAYKEYVGKIEADGNSELSPDVERRLGAHFIRTGDLEKAARVLEHHVATHAAEEIKPDTYFDLAYIHFRGNTLAKSRRYFRLFVEHHKDPEKVERARKLLQRLDRVQNRN